MIGDVAYRLIYMGNRVIGVRREILPIGMRCGVHMVDAQRMRQVHEGPRPQSQWEREARVRTRCRGSRMSLPIVSWPCCRSKYLMDRECGADALGTDVGIMRVGFSEG